MNLNEFIDTHLDRAVEGITPQQLGTYLKAHGWNQFTTSEAGTTWSKIDPIPHVTSSSQYVSRVFVPTGNRSQEPPSTGAPLVDAARQMRVAVEFVARSENRSVLQLVGDVIKASSATDTYPGRDRSFSPPLTKLITGIMSEPAMQKLPPHEQAAMLADQLGPMMAVYGQHRANQALTGTIGLASAPTPTAAKAAQTAAFNASVGERITTPRRARQSPSRAKAARHLTHTRSDDRDQVR